MRRRRRLELIVVLPDGSTLLVPAAWTDLESAAIAREPGEAGTLARVGDLIAARRVLDGLVDRVVLAERDDPGEEIDRAAATRTGRKPGTGGGAVGAGRRAGAPERDDVAGRVDRADGRARGAGR
jgi:hypothetical protein